ncbi:hypothetical protein [Actinomadura chibensis]|uniref:Uncharacterized protein n=1 Tax=Actinomadura chibensis TaxID=392828 RepID=A0A5D0NK18_9ACTN|nr:hypothetical protein [Actinomadura chibensis]TYB44695.1 hypothetical protein FXF69_21315 [Actinomadura chibensis]
MGPPPPPAGPPPAGPPGPAWTGPPPRVRPAAGWYALPAALVLVAVVGFFAVFALLWDDTDAANGPSGAGDPAAGVTVRLEEGFGYFLYVRAGAPSPFACSVKADGRSGPVRLTRKNSWSASDHASYRYTASFTAPVSGTAVLTCRGTDGPILVTPDDTANGYLGFALFAALGLGMVAAVAFIVTILRRSGAKRRAASAGGVPYGY